MSPRRWIPTSFALFFLVAGAVRAQIVINEIMYHPVEKPAFDAAGDPVLDLSEDIHEFIELKNAGPTAVALDGWRLAGGVRYVFPAGVVLAPGEHRVVAKNPERLEAVAAYQLAPGRVLGPWQGTLANRGDTVRLESVNGSVADAVSYSATSPWAVGANAFGAESEWTGIDETAHQYRGRSLERVAAGWPANDPANWLASPMPDGPSPGRPNAVTRAAPRPVVLEVGALAQATGARLIRADEAVRVDARLSSGGAGVGSVEVEFFTDERNSTTEPRAFVPMTAVAGETGLWRAQLPGQPNRSVVRYRIVADRGEGAETVSPRADDPQEWHAYFVSPVRSGSRPQYDIFVSSASLATLAANISGSPRRVVAPDPPGRPRDAWNATEPAVLVRDGRVIDVRLRHHGSRYNRNTFRSSFKVRFPRYARLDDAEALFFKDKGEEHRVGSQLYRAAGLPAFEARYADLYVNNSTVLQRLEVPEMDERHFEKFAAARAARFPGTAVEPTGTFYKASGVVPFETAAGLGTTSVYNASGEGPYFIGNAAPIPPKTGWTPRQRYEFTYGGQMNSWIGGRDTEAMITGLWAARGDTPTAPDPDLPALRTWLEQHFDVEATLTCIALRNWCAPFDNATHNYFLWRRANGRWAMLPWDLDGELVDTTKSIYWDEQAVPQPDTLRGPHWIKDSFLKAFRDEYRHTLWRLNHTVLLPSNFGPSGYGGAQSFATARHAHVNAQLGLGTFYRPATPAAAAPAAGAEVLAGAALRSSAYAHSKPGGPAPAHASTTWIIRAAGRGWPTPVVHLTSTTRLTELPIPFEALTFGETYFWKCVHTDADGHPSFESAERSFVFGRSTAVEPPAVRLNEIFARGAGPDFIEIHNAGTTDAELGGMGLSDDPAGAVASIFPHGTVLPAGGYLVVTLDEAAPFRLSGDGQTVVLTRPDGTLADAVDFGPQAVDRSIGRGPDGWQLGLPTPNAANLPEPTGSPDRLRLNEWMAANPDGPDWFEIVNTADRPVSLAGLKLGNGTEVTTLPPLSFIGAGGFQTFIADRAPGPNHVAFRLSSSGETILLTDAGGAGIDTITFGPQRVGVTEGRLPDGSGMVVAFPGQATPGQPNALAINDIVISRIFPDLELYNRSAAPVIVEGWALSDDPGNPGKYRIPEGFGAVPAGGTRVVPAASLPFVLDTRRGGEVFLSHSGTHRSRRSYGAWDGHAWGLVIREAGDVFVRVMDEPPTPGNVPVVGPVVVSEINYHPPDLPGDDAAWEFVEWLNTGGEPVDVGEWRLEGDAVFTVPAGTVLPAGGRLVIAAVTPEEHAARYDVPPGTPVFGPWTGGLPNSGGRVRVVRRLPPITEPGPDFGFRPQVMLEDIRFRDAVPWPEAADGTGSALVRADVTGFGADAASWNAGAPSPGAAPSENQSPTIAIIEPADGLTAPAGRLLTITASASDPDGTLKHVVLEVDGTIIASRNTAPFSFPWSSTATGPHTLRVTAIDGRLARARAEIRIFLTNEPPLAALISPRPSARLTTGEALTLEARALDPEGAMERVEFLVNGTVVATATNAPWQAPWTAATPGRHTLHARAHDGTGLTGLSPPVEIRVIAPGVPATPVIAYEVPVGTVGAQNYPGSLGHDFEVLSPVVVTQLGVFDSGADGLKTPLVAQLWAGGPAPRRLASLSFSPASPGELAAGTSSRFKPLATPLVLAPGSYTAVASGYSDTERNGNTASGPQTWKTSTGGGLIRFSGASRYGTANQYPDTVDGGPADRYAGPTFTFIDADGDGDFMPLDWEIRHGFNPEDPSDGIADSDGDGSTNQEEFAAGTDPRQAASHLALELVEATPERTTVRLVLPADRHAVLQSSRDLVFWIDRESLPAATTERTLTLSLPSETGPFLRVLVRP